ncbi:hypothetical protein [Candidatus Electronema sp. PJ]|uniref:hypothetical protein n=1 Tax=Candidatus Electronema sp. PJ TaxID=3401572 RepID=UPI003AA80307
MFLKTFLLVLSGLFLLIPGPAAAQSVNVEVVSDRGWIFPTYPISSRDNSWRAYVEAKHDARYGIRVINNTDRRIGLVIAVDGRNIISGQRSSLDSSERMYVLSPYDSQTYDGWRTNRDTINRFYFTNEGDSYAGAWDDYSAMGVIAVAVFSEKIYRPRPQPSPWSSERRNDSREYSAEAAPGTGFGEEEYSSSVRVEFRPERSPLEKHFFKYEWRETLCRKHIISCRPYSPPRENRFWDDDDGYVAPPPR